ncbi:TonB-dependent receptor [Novosphingobium resinovorum]
MWDAGLRWEVTDGVTLRGSRSRNFRAPTLTQLLAPTSTTIGSAGYDPAMPTASTRAPTRRSAAPTVWRCSRQTRAMASIPTARARA